jgi:hypothetical protein
VTPMIPSERKWDTSRVLRWFWSSCLGSDEQMSNDEINLRAFATEVYKHWPAREKFWLNRLEDVTDKVIIFVEMDMSIASNRY